MKFVIFSALMRTGGPFALFQLHDEIISLGVDSEIVFYKKANFRTENGCCQVSYDEELGAPEMAGITARVCREINKDDVLIFPEILISSMSTFQNIGFTNTALWWLSWNNAPVQNLDRLDYAFPLSQAHHLFQSEFAKLRVQDLGYEGLMLSDYTILSEDGERASKNKLYDLCYFGRKAAGAEGVLAELSKKYSIVKIEGMTQARVKEILQETHIFLDFGMHPGKDRIPREAVMSGCLPVVRKVGAAVNQTDVPLPPTLKPTTAEMMDVEIMSDLIHSLKENTDTIFQDLKPYREEILRERATFAAQVKSFVNMCMAH